MDGLLLASVVSELDTLCGGKIDKVYQPEKDEIILAVRIGGENKKILISASCDNCRVQLTEMKKSNPPEPPMFCMLLRKKLTGGKIISFEQVNRDRILKIVIEAQNELGDFVPYTLVVEIMGRHSNIIFLNENNIILDAAKRVGISMSSVRLVMPGLEYQAPPVQNKIDPYNAELVDFYSALSGDMQIKKKLSMTFYGLAPNVAGLLVEKFGNGKTELSEINEDERHMLARLLYSFYQECKKGKFNPTVVTNEWGEVVGVYAFIPVMNEQFIKRFDSISQAIDEFYCIRDEQESIKRKSYSIQKVLQNNIERVTKKLSLYNEMLLDDDKIEQYRLYGELITANLYMIKKGMESVVLPNYYSENMENITVPLDKKYSASENAQRYFKKYRKMKSAKELAVGQRDDAIAELNYLEGQLDNLSKCTTVNELSELREELINDDYIKHDKGKSKAAKIPQTKPMHYVSSSGDDIYVGKNNKQNDNLTLKFASGDDMWLHTKDIPGSHVIIKANGKLSENTIFEAAMLAAYYSKARNGVNVAVDYTPRKFVKKPSGAKAGMVIYTTNKTVFVTPDIGFVKKLTQIE